jgi:hypothetical protein
MAEWDYDEVAIRCDGDRETVVSRLNDGWELVGLTLRGRGGRSVVHAILRSQRAGEPERVGARRRRRRAVLT